MCSVHIDAPVQANPPNISGKTLIDKSLQSNPPIITINFLQRNIQKKYAFYFNLLYCFDDFCIDSYYLHIVSTINSS